MVQSPFGPSLRVESSEKGSVKLSRRSNHLRLPAKGVAVAASSQYRPLGKWSQVCVQLFVSVLIFDTAQASSCPDQLSNLGLTTATLSVNSSAKLDETSLPSSLALATIDHHNEELRRYARTRRSRLARSNPAKMMMVVRNQTASDTFTEVDGHSVLARRSLGSANKTLGGKMMIARPNEEAKVNGHHGDALLAESANRFQSERHQSPPYVQATLHRPLSASKKEALADSKWIPIVTPVNKHQQQQQQQQHQAREGRNNNNQPDRRVHTPMVHHHQNHHYHQKALAATAASQRKHHWRQVAANQPNRHRYSTSKMYRRVLLCDKTLVSLEYVRNLDHGPIPFGAFDEPEELDNHIIELDSQLNEIQLDRTQTLQHDDFNNHTTSMEISLADYEHLTGQSGTQFNQFSRRSYATLSDSDPLVRCDMWDLEKGMKNRAPPVEVLRAAIRTDFETARDAINRCRQLGERNSLRERQPKDGLELASFEDLFSLFSIKRGLIPGTKWCGLGDIAHNYNDLGQKQRIDLCCRAHDHCPIRLKPFRNDYGVVNIALYTKSHCDCDYDFYKCLRDVGSNTADMLGNLYFNVMKLQCLREERMKICRKVRPIALGFERCVKYEESPSKRAFKFSTLPMAY